MFSVRQTDLPRLVFVGVANYPAHCGGKQMQAVLGAQAEKSSISPFRLI
jgi:hypothetical protein